MKYLKHLILVAVLFLLAGACQAQTHQVALTWTASTSTGVTAYNLYRFTGACPTQISLSVFTKLTATPQAGLTYTDTAVTAGTTYCYTVTALNSTNESGPSGTFTASIPFFTASNIPAPPPSIGSSGVQ